VDAKSLSIEQRESVRRTLTPHRDYLAKLVARMDALAWRAEDPMRVEAVKARDAVDTMIIALAGAEPAAPFFAHYGPGALESYVPGPSASAPWVGKRKARGR
jgi:hypothetical protein